MNNKVEDGKLKLPKLSIDKREIVRLSSEEELDILGGGPGANGFDIPTIGWDDGPYCLSKTDWGWCWCYGIPG